MRVRILGLPVDPLRVDAAVQRIVDRAARPDAAAAYVVKPYVEFFGPRATRDVRRILEAAWLSLPDGVALQWAAAYQSAGRHRPADLVRSLAGIVLDPPSVAAVVPERFAGVDFTWALLKACRQRGLSIFLVGSPKHNSIDDTARHLEGRLPGLRLAGTSPGRADELAPEELLATLRRLRPDIVLVGIGFPLQERLMAHLAERLDHGVLIGEGGTFDFREFGGSIRRAPSGFRRAGLEWLWRLGREPRRLTRQLAIPRFIVAVHRQGRRGPDRGVN